MSTQRYRLGGGPAYRAFRATAIVVIVMVFLTPMLWMVLSSFKRNVDINNPDRMFAFEPIIDNYVNVFASADYGLYLFNSVWIALWATVLSLVIGVPSAYAMSRFTMHKSSTLVLLARIIPAISLLVPWYFIFAQIGWVGSHGVQILANMFILIPVCVFILMSFFDSLPIELEEAALVDGLTHIGAFFRILLPLSVSGIATAGILSFIFAWNNFLFPLVLSNSQTKTLPVAVYDFVSYAEIDWGGIMAAAAVMTLPIVLIALFAQRYIVSGLVAGATKG
jgi:multiple sugar transport system permease protein